MRSPIRNSAIAQGIVDGPAVVPIYEVPPNFVILLKSAIYFAQSAAAIDVQMALYRPVGGITVYPFAAEVAGNTTAIWDGWVALNAGDSIVLQVNSTRLHYWLSAALLPFIPGQQVTSGPVTQPSAPFVPLMPMRNATA